ncbi:MAG: thioredoxin family protein [Candidatus Brocadiia bacterium]
MKTLHVLAAAVVVAALGIYGLRAQAQNGPASAPARKPAPGFTLTDQKGNTVKLSDFKGKVVVLEWTNPDCPFVQRHYKAGTMAMLAKAYAPRGVVWLAINTTYYMDRAKDADWAAKQQIAYPVLGDHDGKAGKAYGAKSSPHMFVIDANGNIAYQGAIDNDANGEKKEGAVNYVALALDAVLAGKPVAIPATKPYGCSVKYPPEPK